MTRADYWNHNVHYQPVAADFLAYPLGAPGVPVNLVYRARHREGDPGAPVKVPEMTWAEVRDTACGLLPGVRYRRHLRWRYSLRWRKPPAPP